MPTNIQETKLDNGVRIVHIPVKRSPAVTVMTLVRVGSEYERKNESGLSHFLEHMVFKGTERRPRSIDISLELDQIGASYNAFTSREYTGFYAKAAKKHFPKVADVIADMVLHPSLSEEDIALERGVILEEINMYRDMPQDRVYDNYVELLYGDQPAGRDILGSKETVEGFSRRNFLSFMRRHYTPENLVVVVAGDVKHEKVVATLSGLYGDLESAKETKKPKVRFRQSEPRLSLEYKKTDQTHLIIGSEVTPLDHEDTPALRILDIILGGGMSSRISQKLRDEMGVAYYAGTGLSLESDHGHFITYAGVTRSRVTEVVSVLLDEFTKVRDGLVPEEEVVKAKEYFLGRLLLGLETTDALARFYGFQRVLGREQKSPEQIKEEINAVTVEDVKRVAEKYLNPQRLNLAVVGAHRSEAMFRKLIDA